MIAFVILWERCGNHRWPFGSKFFFKKKLINLFEACNCGDPPAYTSLVFIETYPKDYVSCTEASVRSTICHLWNLEQSKLEIQVYMCGLVSFGTKSFLALLHLRRIEISSTSGSSWRSISTPRKTEKDKNIHRGSQTKRSIVRTYLRLSWGSKSGTLNSHVAELISASKPNNFFRPIFIIWKENHSLKVCVFLSLICHLKMSGRFWIRKFFITNIYQICRRMRLK